jgi:hypothetical protein
LNVHSYVFLTEKMLQKTVEHLLCHIPSLLFKMGQQAEPEHWLPGKSAELQCCRNLLVKL